MFKILNGYENIDSNIFFEIKESKITRGHNYTLVKKQSRLDVRKFSFSQRTINVWNNLSTVYRARISSKNLLVRRTSRFTKPLVRNEIHLSVIKSTFLVSSMKIINQTSI